jgi:hypothetical protein
MIRVNILPNIADNTATARSVSDRDVVTVRGVAASGFFRYPPLQRVTLVD